MNLCSRVLSYLLVLYLIVFTTPTTSAQVPVLRTTWLTVVNNGDNVPWDARSRNFNSYNQPSVNGFGLVVFRARSKDGPPYGEASHGVYHGRCRQAQSSVFWTGARQCLTPTIWGRRLWNRLRFHVSICGQPP